MSALDRLADIIRSQGLEVDMHGRIATPGRYYFEYAAAPYFHELFLSGEKEPVNVEKFIHPNSLVLKMTEEEMKLFNSTSAEVELELHNDGGATVFFPDKWGL